MGTAGWTNTTIVGCDLVEEVGKLKDEEGTNILMHGYGPVAKTVMRNGPLDQLCLWVDPVLAGVGTTEDMIWGEDVHARLALDDVKTLASGVATPTYRAGD